MTEKSIFGTAIEEIDEEFKENLFKLPPEFDGAEFVKMSDVINKPILVKGFYEYQTNNDKYAADNQTAMAVLFEDENGRKCHFKTHAKMLVKSCEKIMDKMVDDKQLAKQMETFGISTMLVTRRTGNGREMIVFV